MSTVSKTKSRDKKAMNDSQKLPSKASGSMVASTGVLAGAYNPVLGTFQTVESLSATGSSSLHHNGRFRNIDESDSTGADCDSASNNGSWSGDSEDHKEKVSTTAAKQEVIIPGADNDKREKMRLKNEKKHQRQKEKRAQELHERCCQFLMSRKLEVLAQQLIAMGISHERATYALMLNEGKIEESVHWLFDDGGAKVVDKKLDPASGNLKLDISQELSRILGLETKFKCSKQDVERAVVTAEGDIEKAEEALRRQKQDQSTASTKAEDVSDNTSSANNSKVPSVHTSQNTVAQLQPNSGMYPAGVNEAKNLGYPRGSSGEPGNQGVHSLDRIHMKLQCMKMQQNAAREEKKRMPQPYQQTPLPRPTEETHYVAALGDQFKRLQQQDMREPVMVMQQQQQQQQRSQSANTSVLPVSTMNSSFTVAATASAGGGSNWYPANRSEAAQSNGYLPARSMTPNDLNSNLMYQQLQYQQQYQGQVNNSHRMGGASSPLAVAPAASLGLFSGYGSVHSGGSTGLDWNADGTVGHLDYNNIDWSLDKGLVCPRTSQQQYLGASPYEAQINGRTRMMGNGNGMGMAMGVQEAALVGNGREWTSPFEGKDLFSLSRQYVPPSL
uniref:UBA domain-containing protein n=1 Tax=Noccaea caerulescens TaxID=107243 RepID=A0A1J3K1I6_NOCCA